MSPRKRHERTTAPGAAVSDGPRFLGVWPILDDTMTLRDLVREADQELVLLAWDTGLVLDERPTWSVRDVRDPGTTPLMGLDSPTGLYLVAEAPGRRHTARHFTDYDTGTARYGAAALGGTT